MNKKIYLLAGCSVLMVLFSSCDEQNVYYKWTDVDCNHADNSGIGPVKTNADTISKNTYGISFSFISVYDHSENAGDMHGETVYEDRISSLDIFSLNDFDSSHPAGNSLNDLFCAFHFGNIYKIPEFVSKVNGQPSTSPATFLLMHPPVTNFTHQFVVKVKLDRGDLLTDTLTPITLN